MPAGLGPVVLRSCGLLQDAPDALGRKAELDEGDAAVERFRLMGDQIAAKPEAAHSLEQDGAADTFGQPRDIAEAEAGITDCTVADRIDKLSEIVASSVVKALQHGGDPRPPGMGSEKTILIDTVLGEQLRQARTTIGLDRLGEGTEQLGKRVHRGAADR